MEAIWLSVRSSHRRLTLQIYLPREMAKHRWSMTHIFCTSCFRLIDISRLHVCVPSSNYIMRTFCAGNNFDYLFSKAVLVMHSRPGANFIFLCVNVFCVWYKVVAVNNAKRARCSASRVVNCLASCIAIHWSEMDFMHFFAPFASDMFTVHPPHCDDKKTFL